MIGVLAVRVKVVPSVRMIASRFVCITSYRLVMGVEEWNGMEQRNDRRRGK